MVKYCTVCGCSIQDNDIVCPKCGNNINEDEKKHKELNNIQQQNTQQQYNQYQNTSNNMNVMFLKNKKSPELAVGITFFTPLIAVFLMEFVFSRFIYSYFGLDIIFYPLLIITLLIFAVICSLGYLYINNKKKFLMFALFNFIFLVLYGIFPGIFYYYGWFLNPFLVLFILAWIIQMFMIYQDTNEHNKLLFFKMQQNM